MLQHDKPEKLNPDAKGQIVIITGMSGAGRTEAMHFFEDQGYYCIDNLPPSLISNLISLFDVEDTKITKLAVVCDIRSREFFNDLLKELDVLKEHNINCYMIYLTASDEVLRNRYSALRRKHPLTNENLTISEAIDKERQELVDVRNKSDFVIDTSVLKAQELKSLLLKNTKGTSEKSQLTVRVYSFGFKYGEPKEANVVIDVRFLKNPYYVPELKELSGLSSEVFEYVMSSDKTKRFLKAWFALLDEIMPGYVKEGKRDLTIAIGCTGGQHRSVSIARETANYLKKHGYHVVEIHRDIKSKSLHGDE